MEPKFFLSFSACYKSHNSGSAMWLWSLGLYSEHFLPGPEFRSYHPALYIRQLLCLLLYYSAYLWGFHCYYGNKLHLSIAKQHTLLILILTVNSYHLFSALGLICCHNEKYIWESAQPLRCMYKTLKCEGVNIPRSQQLFFPLCCVSSGSYFVVSQRSSEKLTLNFSLR